MRIASRPKNRKLRPKNANRAKAYAAGNVSAELKQKFASSSYFKKADAIQVQVASNGIVLLRGQVASESERIRAEGMIRITPGVNDVQNELQIVPVKN